MDSLNLRLLLTMGEDTVSKWHPEEPAVGVLSIHNEKVLRHTGPCQGAGGVLLLDLCAISSRMKSTAGAPSLGVNPIDD